MAGQLTDRTIVWVMDAFIIPDFLTWTRCIAFSTRTQVHDKCDRLILIPSTNFLFLSASAVGEAVSCSIYKYSINLMPVCRDIVDVKTLLLFCIYRRHYHALLMTLVFCNWNCLHTKFTIGVQSPGIYTICGKRRVTFLRVRPHLQRVDFTWL